MHLVNAKVPGARVSPNLWALHACAGLQDGLNVVQIFFSSSFPKKLVHFWVQRNQSAVFIGEWSFDSLCIFTLIKIVSNHCRAKKPCLTAHILQKCSFLWNQDVLLLVIAFSPFLGGGFSLVFFYCFFLLFTRVASCELPPSLLFPWTACSEDDRESFFFFSDCCTETRPWARETICFVHMVHCPFSNSLAERALDVTWESIWPKPLFTTATMAQRASCPWPEGFSDSSGAGVTRGSFDSQPRGLWFPQDSPQNCLWNPSSF